MGGCGLRNSSHSLYRVFIQSPESVEFHTWVGSVFATFNTGQLFFPVFIQSAESVESQTWVTKDLHNPLHNPLHSQLFFTRPLFIALNLSSLIRGWVQFAQPFSQSAILYAVFIQSTESVESHTWVCEVCATLLTVNCSFYGLYSKHWIFGVSYLGGCSLRNPSHSQLSFIRSLFKALNLSSLIRGWRRFEQSLTQSLLDLNSKAWIWRIS